MKFNRQVPQVQSFSCNQTYNGILISLLNNIGLLRFWQSFLYVSYNNFYNGDFRKPKNKQFNHFANQVLFIISVRNRKLESLLLYASSV